MSFRPVQVLRAAVASFPRGCRSWWNKESIAANQNKSPRSALSTRTRERACPEGSTHANRRSFSADVLAPPRPTRVQLYLDRMCCAIPPKSTWISRARDTAKRAEHCHDTLALRLCCSVVAGFAYPTPRLCPPPRSLRAATVRSPCMSACPLVPHFIRHACTAG